MASAAPLPDCFPDLVLNVREYLFADDMAIVVAPANNARTKDVYDSLSRDLSMTFQPLPNILQERKHLFLLRFD